MTAASHRLPVEEALFDLRLRIFVISINTRLPPIIEKIIISHSDKIIDSDLK